MAIEYTIPQILRIVGIRGYSPRLAHAVNKLLTTNDEIEFQQAKKQITKEITGYSNIKIYDNGEEQKGEIFGLPVFMPVVLEPLDESINALLLDDAIVEISRTKNIVTTMVQGRDTSIKEFVNNGDFIIKISGILASGDFSYPKDKV